MKDIDFVSTKINDTVKEAGQHNTPQDQKSKFLSKLKVAIVHEWFVDYAGSEKCVESFNNIFPDSSIYSLVDFLDAQERNLILKGKKSRTSFIQNLPLSKPKFRYYLPFFPHAIEQFDMRKYDIVISNSHSVAKGVLTNTHQLHICYCHTPMRYAWNNFFQYRNVSNFQNILKSLILTHTLQKLRNWDFQTANRPDFFIANSEHIAKQIKKRYNKIAKVIYPPVDTHKFEVNTSKENYYLTVSRMVPYKRIDIIIDAFSKMRDKKLVVVGDGPLKMQLKQKATSNIEFIDPLPFSILKDYMERAKGFISAAEEDFGITVVEAMAAGTPVIAFTKGGTGETVIDNKTGILFSEQSAESLIDGIRNFESKIDSFDAYSIRKYSKKFNRKYFEENIIEFITNKLIELDN